MLTQEKLKTILRYNSSTGEFSRKCSQNGDGYNFIWIEGKQIAAHRLAWLYMMGIWPDEIDHINHCKSDNKWKNLREVTGIENKKNKPMHKNNTSGVCGIYWEKDRKKWLASVRINTKNVNLGRFDDKFEAICARLSANNKYDFHFNHGRKL